MTKEERIEQKAAWEIRIADFKSSGLSGAKWCAANNQKPHQLWYWLKKLEPQAPPETPVRWLPVDLSDPEPTVTVRIGPAVIEVKQDFDPQLLIKLVKTLAAV
jgi:hypothetical protein